MKRRAFLAGLLAAIPAGVSAGWAHTPYGQWVTYRRKHLLIGCHRSDPATYDLAKSLVAEFEHALPKASARVARAPGPQRIASLMGTGQLDVAILGSEEAGRMATGDGMFEPYGPIPLGLLARLEDDKLLIARGEFRPDHAWLIAAAAHDTSIVSRRTSTQDAPIDWHPGAAIWRQGQPKPGSPD